MRETGHDGDARLADRLLPLYRLLLLVDVMLVTVASAPLGAAAAADVLGFGLGAVLCGCGAALLAAAVGGALGFVAHGLWRSPAHPWPAAEVAIAVALSLAALPFTAVAAFLADTVVSAVGLPLLVSPTVAAALTCQAGVVLAILAARRPVVEA